jgi:choline-sulfatase
MSLPRVPWLALFILGHLASLVPIGAAPAALGNGYNVLVLMTDEHNPRIMGCAGDPLVKTPTLDALAARGVRFTAAYCQNPVCTPSRVALASGRMPSNLGTFGNGNTQKYPNVTTIADLFTGAGYQAVWFGKTHWGDPRFQNSRGGDRPGFEENEKTLGRLPQESAVSSFPVGQNSDHTTANEALDFLERNRGEKFFVGVSLIKPHFPFTIQQKYYDLYKGKVTRPRVSEKLIADLPRLSKEEREKYDHAAATEEDILRTKAMYYGMVTYADEELGRIIAKLDELGLREKTIIVYTADHGEMLGDRGIWYKNSFYDGSASIPFIWSFPQALPQGKVVAAPAMNLDVLPTLADLCGLPKPMGLEGTSLLPVLQGTADGRDRIALCESYRGNFAGRMIRTARWKYFFYTTGEEFLYDLEQDPGEETNLAGQPEFRSVAADLKTRATAGWVNRQRGIREVVGLPSDSDATSAATTPGKKKKKR